MYREAQKHFKNADPILYAASLKHEIPDVARSKNVFEDLVQAIVNQQLSGTAAETIFGRIKEAVKEKTGRSQALTAEQILKLTPRRLRSCGLSNAKVAAIRSLAKSVADKKLDLRKIHLLDDGTVIETLTSQKGIGPWTTEMILMFSLGRADIFSKGDLGLRKGIMQLYGLKKMPSDRAMEKLEKVWSPYRTYAARILWRIADAAKKKP